MRGRLVDARIVRKEGESSMKDRYKAALFTAAVAWGTAAIGCSNEAEGTIDSVGGEPSNVTQGGAQDIGEFRRLVEQGEVPPSETLDEVGFFAEHAVDFPEPDCGSSICAHPMLAVAPQFDDGNWTMGFIGLNSPLTAADLELPPRHLLLVVEQSTAAALPSNLAQTIADALGPDDRASIVLVRPDEHVPVTGLTPSELSSHRLGLDERSMPLYPPSADEVRTEAEQLDLYAGLHTALRIGSSDAFDGMAQRVLLFTSGLPSGGATSRANLIDVGQTLGQSDIGVSVFGVGEYFERSLAEALAEASSGNYSVSTSSSDLIQAVESEAASGFVPIGRNLDIEVTPAPGYFIGDIYGARLVQRVGDRAYLRSPVLFLGARQGSDDTDMGRRGGGGGWFVQLVADTEPGEAPAESAPAMHVRVSYDDAFSGETVVQQFTLETPLGVGNNPAPEDPYFSNEFSPKIFMMLNMYLALNGALSYFEQGSCEYALGMQEMMDLSYFLWQKNFDDPDIADDYQLLIELTDAFRTRCTSDVVLWPVEGETSCFYS